MGDLTRFQKRFNVISMTRESPDIETVQTASGYAVQYATAYKSKVTLELPVDSFFDMVQATEEMSNIETDPATAELIKEAKLIYKLKHGI